MEQELKVENLPSNSNSISGFQSVINRIRNEPVKFILLVFFIFFVAGLLLPFFSKNPRQRESPSVVNLINKTLLVLDARLDDEDYPSSIILKFNSPVDPHKLDHYFLLNPQIEGKWFVDENDNNLARYIFDEAYSGTDDIFIYITQGMVSLENTTLLSDYEKILQKNTIEEDVIEQEENTGKTYEPVSNARVKNYPAGQAIAISLPIDKISIYKSNVFNLLNFLTYSMPEKEGRGSIYDGTYTKESISHGNNERVNNFATDKDKKQIYLDPGIYYVETETEEPYFIVISRFGVLLRQDDKKAVVGVFNLEDGRRINDKVVFGFYNLKYGVNKFADFVYSGEDNSMPLFYPARLDAVVAIYNNEVVFVPVELPDSDADINVSSNLDEDTQIFLYTDRPIYKPGDKIFVKGIVRQDSDSLYKIPSAGRTVYLRARLDGREDIEKTANLDEYGTFNAYFTLPDDYVSDYSTIDASLEPLIDGNYKYAYAKFEALKYVKPEFEIKTNVEKSEYLRTEKMKFTITGNYFDGKPLQNKEVEYTLYADNYYETEKAVYNENFNITSSGGMCGAGSTEDYYGSEYTTGKALLNNKGEAVVENFLDDKSLLSQKITLLANIVDKNQNEIVSAVNTIVHAGEFNIFFIPSAERYAVNDEVVVPFYAEKLTGEKIINKVFDYKLVEYEESYSRNKATKIIVSASVNTDDNGKSIVRFRLPKSVTNGYKQLIVTAKDDLGSVVQNQKSLYFLSEDEKEKPYSSRWGDKVSQTYLKITSNQNSFKVGDMVSLEIESPKEIDVLLSFERGRIYSPRFLHLNKGDNKLQFKVTDDMSPSITAVFSFFVNGKYFSEGLSLNTPAMHKLLQVNLSTAKNVYASNDTVDLVVSTRDANGSPVQAQLSVGVVDKAIYSLRKSSTSPIHSSFYYFRPRATNASSSLTGMEVWGEGGRGGGGGGAGGLGSSADILYWNPSVKTDATGEARVPIPLLGHSTIWKAQVYGSTINSEVGQADIEFTATQVKGAKTKRDVRTNKK